MNRHLHIVCANAPWPADNSIAIDTFCKMKALHSAGVKIHLHYFYKNPDCHPTELNKYCESVHTYCPSGKTMEVPDHNCEKSKEIADIISKDDYPVLFEGINCTATLSKLAESNRKIVVRMYNDECQYYQHLAKSCGSFFQKIKMNRISKEMKKYEDALPKNCTYAFSSQENAITFKHDHQHHESVTFLPYFSNDKSIESKTGMGNFCLYHGDLSEPCNEKAVLWLLEKVFNDISTPLVIAGKDPEKQIIKLSEFYNHTCLIVNPSKQEIDDLISKAHINILPSFSNKRPELKLLHALYNGRHCIVNENAVVNTGLEEACHIGSTANAFKSIILQLYHRPFEDEEIKLREKLFWNVNMEDPSKKLIKLLYE